MIGLKRGTVKLAPYNPKWKENFGKEKQRLQKSLGDLVIGIEHVGSTAIPGMFAKPVIDIAIIVKSIKSHSQLIKILERLGYEYKRDDDVPGRLFFTKGPENKRTHYIHVVKLKSKQRKNLILFRDYLLKSKEAVCQYNELKKKLAKIYAQDRKSYTSGKDKFIKTLIQNIQA